MVSFARGRQRKGVAVACALLRHLYFACALSCVCWSLNIAALGTSYRYVKNEGSALCSNILRDYIASFVSLTAFTVLYPLCVCAHAVCNFCIVDRLLRFNDARSWKAPFFFTRNERRFYQGAMDHSIHNKQVDLHQLCVFLPSFTCISGCRGASQQQRKRHRGNAGDCFCLLKDGSTRRQAS